MMYSFGGDTGMSYEALQRKRKITDALMQQKNKPMDVANGLAQGLSSVAGALLGKKLDKREDQMRSDRQGEFTDLFGGGVGGGAASAAQATPVSYASPKPPQGDQAAVIRQGLLDRGLPEHIADAFLMNFKDESGLNPGINEAAPTVPGSRGGFGLYQLTGPRRVAYEKFAKERGINPADVDAQLDFMMMELQGPESRAAKSIFAAPDTGTAAAAIVTDFLRPAEEHRNRRVAQYTSGQPTPAGGGQSRNPADLAQLAQFAADPLLDPAQRKIAEIMLQREMQRGDPMTQLDMQYKQAQIDKMNNPAPAKRETQYVDGVGLIDKATGDVLKQYDTPAKDRPMKQGADKRWRYTDGDKEMVFPDVDANGGNDMTESERRIFMFNSIQKQTGPAINMIEENGFNPSNMKDRFANGVLGGNWLKSQDGQMYDAAAGAWSESALRLATGAAATPEEYDRIKGMYFAQVGDTPETIEFKRAMRESYEGVLGRTLSGDQGEAPNPLMFAIEQFYNDKNGAKPAGAPEVPTGAPAAGIAAPEGGFNFGQMSLPDLSQIDVLSLPREQQDEWEKRMNILMQQNEGGR